MWFWAKLFQKRYCTFRYKVRHLIFIYSDWLDEQKKQNRLYECKPHINLASEKTGCRQLFGEEAEARVSLEQVIRRMNSGWMRPEAEADETGVQVLTKRPSPVNKTPKKRDPGERPS